MFILFIFIIFIINVKDFCEKSSERKIYVQLFFCNILLCRLKWYILYILTRIAIDHCQLTEKKNGEDKRLKRCSWSREYGIDVRKKRDGVNIAHTTKGIQDTAIIRNSFLNGVSFSFPSNCANLWHERDFTSDPWKKPSWIDNTNRINIW